MRRHGAHLLCSHRTPWDFWPWGAQPLCCPGQLLRLSSIPGHGPNNGRGSLGSSPGWAPGFPFHALPDLRGGTARPIPRGPEQRGRPAPPRWSSSSPGSHAMTGGSSTACEGPRRGLLPDQGRRDPRSRPAGGELRRSGREGSLQSPQQGKGHHRILGATGRGTRRCPHRLSLGQRCPTGVCWVAQRSRTQALCALCRQHLGVSSMCLRDAPAGPW